MSAPFINTRVKIDGTSKSELNGQQGTATSYNSESMRYTVMMDNGQPVALKVVNLIPIGEAGQAGASGGGGGGGGFPGMAGMGMPDISQMLNQLPVPAWLKEKLTRGETPTMDDLRRLLPPGVTAMHVGAVAASFLLMFFKFGIIKTVILFALLGFIAYAGFGAFSEAGGGVSGLKAAGTAVGERLSAEVEKRTQRNIPPNLALGALGAALLAAMYYIFLTGGSAAPSFQPYSAPPYPGLAARDAYGRGYDDAQGGKTEDWSRHADEFSGSSMGSMGSSMGSMGSSMGMQPTQSSGGMFAGFGFGKMFSLAILGKQIYSLGSVPGGGWDINFARVNVMNMSAMQKGMMMFMVARLVGMSPI
jgi:hypothetical protein